MPQVLTHVGDDPVRGLVVRWTSALLASIVALGDLSAQVVRGTVTERLGGQPVPGVLVSIASVADSNAVRHTLSNARGEYAIRLSSGGRYSVSAKRIGVARYTADVLTLGEGETRRLDIALDRFEHKLPVVNVRETNLCFRRSEQRQQIVALWDEVRTALIATGVTREERLLNGFLSRYVRALEPASLRILEDRRSVSEGFFERPMRSISGDSLAKVGYWRAQDADTLVFYGPDEDVLLSSAFRSGHCFELITGKDAIRGFIGLGFRPKGQNLKGGIEGTLWIDAGNFELRFIEFRYTNLITIPTSRHLGGQVHYTRHPSGAWLVRRWFLRMPVFPTIVTVDVGLGPGRATQRPVLWRILEEGGGLYTLGLRSWETPGTITGIVTDSTGQTPLRGTVVGLSGTPFSTEVDSLGRFRFDSIAPGAYTLLASHPTYAMFGQLADDDPLTLESGKEYRATMRAITTTQLRTIICDAARAAAPLFSKEPAPPPPGAATLRILLTRSDSGTALPRFPVWLRWRDPEQEKSKNPLTIGQQLQGGVIEGQRVQGVQSFTDEIGGVTFCGVPSETEMELVMLHSGVRITSFTLKRGELSLRSIAVVPSR